LQERPELFFKDILGCVTLEGYQERLLRAIAENDRVVCSACHDVGKSFSLARVALWFASAFPYCKVITTAPTFNQVQNILWAEMRSAHAKSKVPLGGQINLTEWKLDDNWFALGFTPKNEAGSGADGQGSQSSFQGFHASGLTTTDLFDPKLVTGGVLIIFDEATGIPKNIWTMAEGLMTSAHVKFVAIANPTSTASEFYRKFKDPSWFKVRLSCFDSPNLIANGFTDKEKLKREVDKVKAMPELKRQQYLKTYKVTRPYLLTTKWVVEKLIEWGFDHPLSLSKIFGEFPEATDGSLVSLGAIERAQLRLATGVVEVLKTDRKCVGIDVARGGTDETIITLLHGKKQVGFKKMNVRDGRPIVGEALRMAREAWGDDGADIFVVDVTGVGSSVVDFLKEVCGDKKTPGAKNAGVRAVQFGEAVVPTTKKDLTKSDRALKEKFVNVKARMFRLLADDIKDPNGLGLMDESVYAEELTSIRYGYNAKGQMVVQSKDDYKKRFGRGSPDASDSLALANFGRYDELDIGTFGEEHSAFVAPLATRIKNQRKW